MTPESLMFAVDHGTEQEVADLLAHATEKERKAASIPLIEKLEEAVRRTGVDGVPDSLLRRIIFQTAFLERKLDGRPLLALLGTGTFAEVKRYASPLMTPLAYDVLAARRPKWLSQWCQWALGDNSFHWPLVRHLVRDGLAERPETDQYYLYMLHGGGCGSARALLDSDPALLDHEIWELFRRQGLQDASLTHDFLRWSDALAALSREGRLDRARLLDASLAALELPFKPHHTSWYRSFHLALAPTPEERAARLPVYLGLASSHVPATVKFAVKALEEIEKAGALPVDEFLAAAGPALARKEKGTATTVLKMLERLLASQPGRRQEIAAVAANALEHPSPELQSAALAVLERARLDASDLDALVAPRLDLAAASVRDRAQSLTGEPAAASGPVQYTPDGQAPDPLSAATPLAPIEDIEELVLTMQRLIHQETFTQSADDMERVLDGVSRLCAHRPPRFDDLTSPLRSSIEKHAEFLPQVGCVLSTQMAVIQMALAWLMKIPIRPPVPGEPLIQAALGGRLHGVTTRVSRAEPRALICTPTHTGGWIDPRVLVERLAHSTPDEGDLAHALYRLAPSHREEALAAAQSLPGDQGRAVRYALGASEEPGASALWPAARHARQPQSLECHLEWTPDRFNPGLFRPLMKLNRTILRKDADLSDAFAAETQPLDCPDPNRPWSGVDPLHRSGMMDPGVVAWAALLAPASRDSWCALGALRLAANLDWDSAEWGNRRYLSVLAEPWTAMSQPSSLLLALGLMAREATEWETARDAFTQTITESRLHCDRLGAALASLFAANICRSGRLARAFADATRLSPRHADAVRQVIQHALAPGLPPRAADQSALLEALFEACSAAGSGPSADLRRLLQSVSGSGKGPKLARNLLTMSAPG